VILIPQSREKDLTYHEAVRKYLCVINRLV
jgi:hypothetical protein